MHAEWCLYIILISSFSSNCTQVWGWLRREVNDLPKNQKSKYTFKLFRDKISTITNLFLMFTNTKIVFSIKNLTADKSKLYEKKALGTSLELTRLQKNTWKTWSALSWFICVAAATTVFRRTVAKCARNDLEFAILVF